MNKDEERILNMMIGQTQEIRDAVMLVYFVEKWISEVKNLKGIKNKVDELKKRYKLDEQVEQALEDIKAVQEAEKIAKAAEEVGKEE